MFPVDWRSRFVLLASGFAPLATATGPPVSCTRALFGVPRRGDLVSEVMLKDIGIFELDKGWIRFLLPSGEIHLRVVQGNSLINSYMADRAGFQD
jgi:hypothetical protein